MLLPKNPVGQLGFTKQLSSEFRVHLQNDTWIFMKTLLFWRFETPIILSTGSLPVGKA